jgi:hypothetical protein
MGEKDLKRAKLNSTYLFKMVANMSILILV